MWKDRSEAKQIRDLKESDIWKVRMKAEGLRVGSVKSESEMTISKIYYGQGWLSEGEIYVLHANRMFPQFALMFEGDLGFESTVNIKSGLEGGCTSHLLNFMGDESKILLPKSTSRCLHFNQIHWNPLFRPCERS